MTEFKASKGEKEVLESYLIPFLNLEKRFPLLPGIENNEAMAHLMGLKEEDLIKLRNNFKENAKKAALELLEEDNVTEWIDQLPFDDDDTIVALGDSLTDDLQGWFSIFSHALDLTVPGADFTFINKGISYDTSSDLLKRLNRDLIDQEPDWVIVAIGTFDAQRLHVAPDRTLISLAEFWENINTIESVIEDLTDHPPVWITPPPVIAEMLQKMRLFDFDIFEEDLKDFREIISGKKGYIVDPTGIRMGEDKPEAWNYLSDGLHPSLSGHVNTVKALLHNLAVSEKTEGSKLEAPKDLETGGDPENN